MKTKTPCKECGKLKTCLHDEKCEHGAFVNREGCEHQCAGYFPTPEEQKAIEHAQTYNKWRDEQGLSPLPLPKPKHTKTHRGFMLSDDAYQGILRIANELGYQHDNSRQPNPTAFLEALGQGLLHVMTG